MSSTQTLASWYSAYGTERSFLSCGSEESWSIVGAGDLPSHTHARDMQPDDPVYVKLLAQVSAANAWPRAVHVQQVVQFGSSTPVRDCPVKGVVTRRAPAAAASC